LPACGPGVLPGTNGYRNPLLRAVAREFAAPSNLSRNSQVIKMPWKIFVLLAIVLFLGGCASGPPPGSDGMTFQEFQSEYTTDNDTGDLNQQILSRAVATGLDDSVYRLGPGDEVSMKVFGVDELSGDFRIDGMGQVSLPLIGDMALSGYSLSEAEEVLAERYGAKYLRNPQVNLSVVEFRSQQFTAIGALAQPRIYATERKVSLIEALAMAGGLAGNAGETVYLTDRVRDAQDGTLKVRNLVINIEDLMQGGADTNVVLGESAVINVPVAGSFFVEGAVERPGVYTQAGDITVLKAITMAGGLKFEANRSRLNVLRRNPETNQWDQETVAMNDIRESPLADVTLRDGDIVMVESGPLRTAWVGAWEGLRRLVMVGYRPISP